jgi:hypothetical protein
VCGGVCGGVGWWCCGADVCTWRAGGGGVAWGARRSCGLAVARMDEVLFDSSAPPLLPLSQLLLRHRQHVETSAPCPVLPIPGADAATPTTPAGSALAAERSEKKVKNLYRFWGQDLLAHLLLHGLFRSMKNEEGLEAQVAAAVTGTSKAQEGGRVTWSSHSSAPSSSPGWAAAYMNANAIAAMPCSIARSPALHHYRPQLACLAATTTCCPLPPPLAATATHFVTPPTPTPPHLPTPARPAGPTMAAIGTTIRSLAEQLRAARPLGGWSAEVVAGMRQQVMDAAGLSQAQLSALATILNFIFGTAGAAAAPGAGGGSKKPAAGAAAAAAAGADAQLEEGGGKEDGSGGCGQGKQLRVPLQELRSAAAEMAQVGLLCRHACCLLAVLPEHICNLACVVQ